MAENKYTGMLQAYALGCLNSGDYARMLNFIERGEDYPAQDLGEFQNLVALLPAILENETPPKSVKENIARQLYYIKDAAKEEKIKPAVPADLEEEPEQETTIITEEETSGPEPLKVSGIEIPEPDILEDPDQLLEKYVKEIASVPGVMSPESDVPVQESQEPLTSEDFKAAPEEPEIIEVNEPEIIQETPAKEEAKETLKEPPVKKPEPVSETPKETAKKKEIVLKEEIENEQPLQVETPAKSEKKAKEEAKPSRSFGDFLAEADIKAEETVGKIEFEDYFAQTKRAEIQSRETTPKPKTPVRKAEPAVAETSQRKNAPAYRESKNYAKSGSSTAIIVSSFLILLTAAVLYYYFNSELKLFKSDNEKMTGELTTLKAYTETSKGVLDILSKKEGRTFNLSGGQQNAYSFGKVIYSAADGKGFIHAGSLPELKETMSYQFWINAGGRNFMIYRFTKASQLEFYPFSIQRINLNQPIRIFLTEEPFTGSDSPSRTVLLNGYN